MTMPALPAEDSKDLLEVANGASDAAWSSWLAFLLLLTYVMVTLAGVSHQALLLNSPVKLPIINADIPIVGFFQYAPALLLLVYLSLLIQHVILARKYRKFTDAIAPYELETGNEHPARERVHSYVFSQLAAGPRPNLITKAMMQLIVYVTFSILPIITLLYFQIKFLPYHDVTVTYWHRLAVILGFVMLILLTPLMQSKRAARRWNIKVGPQAEAWEASGTQVILVLILLPLVIGFSWLIATVPNEWIDRQLGFVAPASLTAGAQDEARLLNPLLRSVVYDNLADDGDKGWWRRWLLSYRVLIVEDGDLTATQDAVLRERNVRFALLNRSDLHRADLTWADLRGTQLWKTIARGKFKDALLQGAYLREAKLQGAQLNAAKLQGADLSKAQLQGAELNYADLRGADLRGATLQGADLGNANLEGADLRDAQLQGANLAGTKLAGANLAGTEVWLVAFPPELSAQSPAPSGAAALGLAPLSAETKGKLKQDLSAGIADQAVLSLVMTRLDPILRDEPPGFDPVGWTAFAGSAQEPSPAELARFHAELACDDSAGAVAGRMAARALETDAWQENQAYAKALTRALLDENCKGGSALTKETRESLKALAARSETQAADQR